MRYREFGFLFGIGAWVIDVAMHAYTEGHSFSEELVSSNVAEIIYRSSFIVFGVAMGWLLWQKNNREREWGVLLDRMRKLRREISGPAAMIHANIQYLLTTTSSGNSKETEAVIRSLYDQSKKLQLLTREMPE